MFRMFDHSIKSAKPALVPTTLPFGPSKLPSNPLPPPPPPPLSFQAPSPPPTDPWLPQPAPTAHPLQRAASATLIECSRLPHLLTLPHPKVPAFAMLDDNGKMVSDKGLPVAAHPTRSMVDAFSTTHSTDEHLVLYSVEDANGPTRGPVPRITKGAVASLFDPSDRCGYKDSIPGIVRVGASALALDFDLPEHVRWTPTHKESVMRILGEAGQVWPLLLKPSVFYTTSGGLRLVWFLTRSVDVRGVGGLEDLLHGLVSMAYMSGLLVDPACKDWTRLFRLPRVTRLDKQPAEAQTWKQGYFAQSYGRIDFEAKEERPAGEHVLVYAPESFTPISEMAEQHFLVHPHAKSLFEKWKGRVGKPPRDWVAILASIETGTRPLDDEVQRILTGTAAGKTGTSALYRSLVNRLRSLAYTRDPSKQMPEAVHLYTILEEEADLREEISGQKQLHQGLMKFARCLCYALGDRLGEQEGEVTPQVAYAIALQPARLANMKHQAEGQKAREDGALCREVWDIVVWFYQRFRSQSMMRIEDEIEAQIDQGALKSKLLAQVGAYQEAIVSSISEWSGGFESVDDKRRGWIEANWGRMMIAKSKKGFSIITVNPNGALGFSVPVENWEDISCVHSQCNHSLLALTTVNKDGVESWRRRSEIMRESAMIVEDYSMSRLITSNRVKLINSPDNRITIGFVEALPGMNRDIVPVFDPQVDEWLHLLAGGEPKAVNELLDWLAAYPRIDLPAPAMYIQGDAGIGKGMLALSLAQMTERKRFAKFDDFLGDFQDGLETTPFIWTDEAVTQKNTSKRVMDTFKMIVTGEANSLNPKGHARVSLEGYWRLLVTSNHDHAIPWDQEVSGSDLNAVTARLHHLVADSAGCQRYLERLGNRTGTVGWVEKRIPQHVAYLSATRKLKLDQRLLTQPEIKDFHQTISISSGQTSGVAAMLGRLFQMNPAVRDQCVVIKDGSVYVLPDPTLIALHELNRQGESLPKSTKLLSKALKQLSLDEDSTLIKVKVHPLPIPQCKRGWRLDMSKLIGWLHKNGGTYDLRKYLGDAHWKAQAPAHIYAELLDTPEMMAPPPPPPKTNVIQFSGMPPAPPTANKATKT